MKIVFLVIGKTSERYLSDGMAQFEGRLKHYSPYETIVVSDVKSGGKRSAEVVKELESQAFQKYFQGGDWIILLDEKGKRYHSRGFAQELQKWMNGGPKRLVFVVGGAFGFSRAMYERANGMLSMSEMTTSHQLIRVVFLEQLYRAFTILNNEPYHND
ncbi:MAG: 23S rRNA (pseudouridine(1915)-N(3))-methyltransferase RlmH [Schleiferiaceae bacterium]|jgi:23S rRNA (pseudouridine1915-N3)-methyltransferase|nr:23S rRNA (pseudouridine(1915)-N(3))-methyltransferase RlmH [Schleiferiaceae bacterium]MDG1313543.1 23S rRNA (pseudouridine(1915)-N(3))-methyltransferase RlmH [Schleiferiaceae bacterium]MDG1918421.1 23S rRNA (pseudouridine(1915)-N(3))-methyltransferase RlmH [Schleiferiaceae bacterium]